MKKSIIAAISVMLFVFLIFHLCTAYVNWDLNPQNWDAPHRGFVAIFGGFISICVGFAAFIGTINEDVKQ